MGFEPAVSVPYEGDDGNQMLLIHDCGAMDWFDVPPVDGACDVCDSSSADPDEWRHLFVQERPGQRRQTWQAPV